MFAVVDMAGFQEKVQVGDTLQIPLQDEKNDANVVFKNVLLIAKDDGDVVIGKPFVDGASVEVKVIGEGKDKKIRVLKMKRRKRYMRTKGHQQQHTMVEVMKING